MNLMRYLVRNARGMILFTVITGIIGGACNAGLIAVVNHMLIQPDPALSTLLACFVALGLGKLLTNFISQTALARFAQEAMAKLRLDLVRKILSAPLRHLEQVGTPRLFATLTDDVLNMTQALLAIPVLAVNAAILLGGAIYMAWLSWKVLLLISGFIFVGGLSYRWLIRCGFKSLGSAREEEDRLFTHFRSLTDGIKELKLHRNRRGSFLTDNIQSTTTAYQRHNVAAEYRFVFAHGLGHLLVFTLLGLMLFGLPTWGQITQQALTGYVVTTLYLMGPLAGVMGSLSVFTRADVAFRKVEQLGFSLASNSTEVCPLEKTNGKTTFEQLELRGISHSYKTDQDDHPFTLGPLNLTFEAGEIVYIVGGNGSGKSTLAKIVTGLYPPEQGSIFLNGERVTDENRDSYRQMFSVVFADFFLFEDLLGLDRPRLDAQANEYLVQLGLHHKLKITNGHFSTTALSQGQRKRLALLTAYLEDRPLYLFDEWASDQDPVFKDVFYTRVLPDLKARGKTVLVITHDDKYFHKADRIIKLDYGKLVHDKQRDARPRDPVLQT